MNIKEPNCTKLTELLTGLPGRNKSAPVILIQKVLSDLKQHILTCDRCNSQINDSKALVAAEY
ncbi:hypothetical protein L0244_04435, partial [bacterium]|nr:hypothetical protein [bacterium]